MQSAAFTAAEDPYTLIAVVTPMTGDPATSGKIKHLPCAPQVKHKWLRAYDVGGGMVDYAVEPLYQRAGYVLLRDLFEAEGLTEEWKLYQQLLKDLSAGRRVKPFPEDKLPREVRRRRACGAEPEAKAEADAPAQGKGRGRA